MYLILQKSIPEKEPLPHPLSLTQSYANPVYFNLSLNVSWMNFNSQPPSVTILK